MKATSTTPSTPYIHTMETIPVRLPKTGVYPFSDVCSKIVEALSKRNWKVPGIDVKFRLEGSGAELHHSVYVIKGGNFRISYLKDKLWVLNIPFRRLACFSDPKFHQYVGSDWENDKADFMNGEPYMAKCHGHPRTYLMYHGSWKLKESLEFPAFKVSQVKIAPYLEYPFNDTDDTFGRHYKPLEGEPTFYKADQIYQDFAQWLKEKVMPRIESVEEAAEIEPIEKAIPYPADIGPIYAMVSSADLKRIQEGNIDMVRTEATRVLPPSDRYALKGRGGKGIPRPLEGEAKSFTGKYISAYFDKPKRDEFDNPIVKVRPKSANHIYVVDRSVRKQFGEEFSSDEERKEYKKRLTETMVPIHQYKKGDFQEPMVLIADNREISFDEVEVVYNPESG